MPSQVAALAPSTTVGKRSLAVVRKVPDVDLWLRAAGGGSGSAASTVMPLPLASILVGRRTPACTLATRAGVRDRADPRAMPTMRGQACAGCRSGTGRGRLPPGAGRVRVGEFVQTACWLEAGMPVTTTIVAMPMEMPRADSTARRGRDRVESRPRTSRSMTAIRTGCVSCAPSRRRAARPPRCRVIAAFRPGRVIVDPAVAQPDSAGELGGDVRSCVMTAIVVPVAC